MRFGRFHRKFAAAALVCLAVSVPAWAADDGGMRPTDNRSWMAAQPAPPPPPLLDAVGRGASCSLFVHAESLADGRTHAVQSFLESHSCAIADLASDFVLAAELNRIDYRLLPVLAVLETGCGRAARNNNLFGWANGRKPFGSFRQSIHFVAQRLRIAPHYSGKTVSEKLKVYNRRPAYRRKVLALMQTMPEAAEELPLREGSAEASGSE